VVVNPSLILADEPTGNLDPGLSRRLMDVFKQFHAYGTTIDMATHNMDMLAMVPSARIIHLEGGRITLDSSEPQPPEGVHR
jgi:cell division transport system ATP-binding protein